MAEPTLLLDAISPDSRERYDEATQISARYLSPWTVDVEVRTQGGETRWVRGMARPRRMDDGGVLWDGLIFDITAEKQLEFELHEKDSRLSQAKKLARMGYFSFYAERDVVWWSEETFQIYGVDSAGFAGAESEVLSRVAPEDRGRVVEARRRCQAHGEPWDMEYRIVRDDGAKRVLHSVAEPNYDGDRIVGISGSVQDVTERANAAQELANREAEAQRLKDLLTGVVENVTDGFAVFDK